MLIKGNNLIALHSLKAHFKTRPKNELAKLIYIDPPYNTGNDSFNYNDKFNHSTWLTFMKNRLEVARELLRDDGVIFVQCDDNEQAYLKVLMDEIFGRENFVGGLINQRASGGGVAKFFVKGHDYIMCYAKNILEANPLVREKKISGKILEKNGKQYIINDDVVRKVYGKYQGNDDRRCFYEELEKWKNKKQIAEIQSKIDNGEYILKKHHNGMHIICRLEPIDGTSKVYSILTAFSAEGKKEMEALGLDFVFPKPEELLMQLIFATTVPSDLVLDFFAGSGTTLAVAHKMKRRYIGIEQMDYIKSITKERLKKVITGEQGGISKAVNWQGGGEFIYLELAKLNDKFINLLQNATKDSELDEIYHKMKKEAFLDYRVEFENLQDLEFWALEFEEKRRVLKMCLDRNMDYLPYCDIDDESYEIDDKTKKLNEIFYKGQK